MRPNMQHETDFTRANRTPGPNLEPGELGHEYLG